MGLRHECRNLGPVSGLADDFHVWVRAKDHAQACSNDLLVVDDSHLDRGAERVCHGFSLRNGSWASISKPPVG